MVSGVVDSAVVRVDQPFRAALVGSAGVEVALVIAAVRQGAFVVAEPVAADRAAGCIRLERAALPAECLRLLCLLYTSFVWNVNSGSLHLSVREVAQILLMHSGDNAVDRKSVV